MENKIFDKDGRLREEAYLSTTVALKVVDESGQISWVYYNPNSQNPVAAAENNLLFYTHVVKQCKLTLYARELAPASDLAAFINRCVTYARECHDSEVKERAAAILPEYEALYWILTGYQYDETAPKEMSPINVNFHPNCFGL